MKTSPAWLQKYFEKPLPAPEKLADALTFHTTEVEEITPTYIDLKILPDRAAYMLCHRGAARELSAALRIPLKEDPLRTPIEAFPSSDAISVQIEDPDTCARCMVALVKGVRVGPSPAWLKEALEAVGQRSINNVVDATNYVMLDIGQPLHAMDAASFRKDGDAYAVGVRAAREDEPFTTLTGDEYALPEGVLLVTDAHTDLPVDIAGIKGGKAAAITETTTDLIIEAANFDGTRIRRAAQALKLFTDASSRMQNRPSPALVAYGMRDVLALITATSGGEVVGVADAYPHVAEPVPVTISLDALNGRLGSTFVREEVQEVFEQLGFTYTEHENVFTVLPPFERQDILIPEDLAEEVGRILGYERIPSLPLPGIPHVPEQAKFRGLERIRDFLVERGYIEISTPSFDTTGNIELANPLQQDRPWLRSSLMPNLEGARTRAAQVAPRVLGPGALVKLFEIGTVFTEEDERTVLGITVEGEGAEEALKENVATLEQELLQAPGAARFSLDAKTVEVTLSDQDLERLGKAYEPQTVSLGSYRPFSLYPFALRDVAVWTPAGTTEEAVADVIRREAGALLVRLDCFDRFEKEGRISYAFRLVFESQEQTLSDAQLNPLMERVTEALNATAGFAVR